MFRHRAKFNKLHYTSYFASIVETILNIILGKLHRHLLTFTGIVLELSPQSHDTGNKRCSSGPKVDYLFIRYTMP